MTSALEEISINNRSKAISEIIGTILLLFIAVMLFSVIYYLVLTVDDQPVDEVYATIYGEIVGNKIVLTHHGGESIMLKNSQITAMIGTKEITTFNHHDLNNNDQWDVGETIEHLNEDLSEVEVNVRIRDSVTNTLLYYSILQEGDVPSGPISLNTSVNHPASYLIAEPKLSLTATGDSRLSSVQLWYRFSHDTITWGGNQTIGEIRVLKDVDSSWTTIDFWNEYDDPVVIGTSHLESSSHAEVCVRIKEVDETGCEIKLQNPGEDHVITQKDVHLLVMERGSYYLNDGRKIEANYYLESETAENNNWDNIGTYQPYNHTFSTPVVLGSVMSANDNRWSVPYFTDGNRGNPPDASALFTSKHVGEDVDETRLPEIIGYVVIEQGTGTIEELQYEAMLGDNRVDGVQNEGDTYSLSDIFSVGVATQGGMDGTDGSWTVLYGDNPISSTLTVASEEDTIGDTDRSHINEQVNYWVFSESGNITSNVSYGKGWKQWNHDENPDNSYPWRWVFNFPEGPGYYEFYSIGRNETQRETKPSDADARCQYSIESTINPISPYQITYSPVDLTATASESYDNVSLYYRYSEDNVTWDSVPVKTALVQGSYLADGSVNLNLDYLNLLRFNNYHGDESYFNFSEDQPTRLTVKRNGDYLLSFTLPMERLDSNSRRTCIQTEIFVNGMKQEGGVARSSYIRLDSDHSESSDHINLLLHNLSINDYIEVKVKGITSRTGDEYQIATSTVFSLFVEFISSSETMFSATSTQTTDSTDLNQEEAYKMEWVYQRKNDGYTHSDMIDPEDITLEDIGAYLVYVNIPLESNSQRTNIQGTILLDDMMVEGGVFQQGYIRNAENHDQSSIHWSGPVITTSQNQTLSVFVEKAANSGTVTVGADKATICIRKIPDQSIFVSTATKVGRGDNWNPGTDDTIVWDNDMIINTTVFSHSETLDSDQITIQESGDYHLVYNGAFFLSGSIRSNNKIFVEVNGITVPGAESKTNYIRNANDHEQASACLSVLLRNLEVGDIITVNTLQEANDQWVDDEYPSVLMIWKKELSAAQDWMMWQDVSNPDSFSPWSWSFSFPQKDGYYEFLSIAMADGYEESYPDDADAICHKSTYSTPIALWRFDENTGTTASDFFGGNDGILYGADWTNGINESGVVFNGSSDYVKVPSSSDLDVSGDQLSVEAWVKWDTNPNMQSSEIIVDKPQNESWQSHYSLFHINTKFGFSVFTDEGHQGAYSSPPLLENHWYHVVGTYNGSSITIYVNGVAERTKDLTGSMKTSIVPVTIGSEDGLDSYFKGVIDEVAIYDMALSPQEILMRYQRFQP